MECDSIQKRVLDALLDKYERSASYRENKQPSRRVMLYFYAGGKCDFDYYDIEQSERRISVNRAVIQLEEQGFVSIEWMEAEYLHIISKVSLNIDNILQAYHNVDRIPKGDRVDIVLQEIDDVRRTVKTEWVCRYLQDTSDVINAKQSIPSSIPNDDEERSLLLKSLTAIDKADESEFTERVFSIQMLGDSKAFERYVKNRLLRILRKYTDVDDSTEEDILKQIGIVKYPEQFEFCGNTLLLTDYETINFSCLTHGCVIYSSDALNGCLSIDESVKSVITIENRANYIDYIKKSKKDTELVIYHGGQYSPRKRKFFQAIAGALPSNCSWYHWSDIDYGGFLMLSRLRREVFHDISPYRMNIFELEQYSFLTASIDEKYAKKLESIKSHAELTDCNDCIDYMVKHMVRLEQEAMLTDL